MKVGEVYQDIHFKPYTVYLKVRNHYTLLRYSWSCEVILSTTPYLDTGARIMRLENDPDMVLVTSFTIDNKLIIMPL